MFQDKEEFARQSPLEKENEQNSALNWNKAYDITCGAEKQAEAQSAGLDAAQHQPVVNTKREVKIVKDYG